MKRDLQVGALSAPYKRISILLFGWLADRLEKPFEQLRKDLTYAGVTVLLKTWLSMMLLSAAIAYAGVLTVMALIGPIIFDSLTFLSAVIAVPVLSASGVFFAFYLYPIQQANSLRRSIENDMPFAVAHMSAISSAGIPPEFMFELLTDFKEYGTISKQAGLIVRNIKAFGMSSVNAINAVADRTPSQQFRQMLTGISSTIEKGGNIEDYLKQVAEAALFDYRIKREKYLKTLSTYADIYTALLVASPLMMLAVLGIMSIIGGQVLGLTINDLITLITWVGLPFLNVCFLAFIHITYPGT